MKVRYVENGTAGVSAAYTAVLTGRQVTLDAEVMDTKYGREHRSDNERLADGEFVAVIGFHIESVDLTPANDGSGEYDVFFNGVEDLVGRTIPLARMPNGSWCYYQGDYMVDRIEIVDAVDLKPEDSRSEDVVEDVKTFPSTYGRFILDGGTGAGEPYWHLEFVDGPHAGKRIDCAEYATSDVNDSDEMTIIAEYRGLEWSDGFIANTTDETLPYYQHEYEAGVRNGAGAPMGGCIIEEIPLHARFGFTYKFE